MSDKAVLSRVPYSLRTYLRSVVRFALMAELWLSYDILKCVEQYDSHCNNDIIVKLQTSPWWLVDFKNLSELSKSDSKSFPDVNTKKPSTSATLLIFFWSHVRFTCPLNLGVSGDLYRPGLITVAMSINIFIACHYRKNKVFFTYSPATDRVVGICRRDNH